MKVLAYVSARRRNIEGTQTETVISSLVMMGVAPFFRNFGLQPPCKTNWPVNRRHWNW